ncbi:TonB-dependent siderophore receptor [Agrobacterium larrymoorei]|uniref:TonB-dependent siderophore receptor n=1 Tax=Agrobacterium larrymoorei TaxID=160699 RepID=A0AAF0HDX0_9HYPH|nr:TonB-dependent siderophore receptor [Agrobacterium larrymoorei]WHA42654.1 TonB-dependent siderophore receptor [Agrobacterium larrymoorei]
MSLTLGKADALRIGQRLADQAWKGNEMAFGKRAGRRTWLTTTAILSMTLATAAGTQIVLAQGAAVSSSTVNLSIPAGPLENALLTLGRQANLKMLYPSSITTGKTTAGVRGTVGVSSAVTQLLAGSGLSFTISGNNTVRIFDPNATGSQAAAASDGSTVLETIVVQGSGSDGVPGVVQTDGYVAKSGRTATKTDTPVAETAQSVSVVSRKQLDDRQPQNVVEAVSYTPGAHGGQFGAEPRFDSFSIRGMDVTYSGVFRDGLRQINSPNGLFRLEPYDVEAMTVLRGPAASIYGASSTGGIVDIISKRPTEEQLREVELQYGSYGRVQAGFDLSGPVTQDGSVLYRLTGVARDARNEISAIKDDRVMIAPAITWKPDEGTKFTVLGEYMDSTTGGTWGYINDANGATPVYGGDARFNDFRQKQGRIGYELEHELADGLTLHHKLRYSQLSTSQEYVFANYPGSVYEDNQGLATDTYFEGEFETGGAQHKLIGGVDYSHMEYDSRQGVYDADTGVNTLPFTDTFTYVPVINKVINQKQNSIGVYAQDQIALDAWRIGLGLRHDWHKSDYTLNGEGSSRDDSITTGRASIGYVTPWNIMPYISYGTSYVANAGVILTGAGGQADPTRGKQFEIGAKYEIPDSNILLSAAYFDLDQKNASVWAYNSTSSQSELQQLDLRSRGIELEVTGSLDNGLSFTGGYSYNDVEITKLTPETVGNQLNATPYHMFSLWANYDVQTGPLEGLGLGAGVRYVGSSFGDNTHTTLYNNHPRTFVDATIRYDLGKLNSAMDGVKLQVNATNLLNEVNQICSSAFCYYDEGRKVVASVKYQF